MGRSGKGARGEAEASTTGRVMGGGVYPQERKYLPFGGLPVSIRVRNQEIVMKLDRRQILVGTLAATLASVLGLEDAQAGPRRAAKKRRRRSRRRRRVRRRIRRRVRRRTVRGRKVWVIPVATAVGWELVLDDRVVVVKETKTVERDGVTIEVVVVLDSSGKTEEIEVHREADEENSKELEGTELAADDTSTPAIETEVEEEIEEAVDD